MVNPLPESQLQASEEVAGMACHRTPRPHPQIQTSEQGSGAASRISPCPHPQIEDGGCCRRASPAAPLPDDDDMLREILLRLPPQPSSLPRAAAVCKRWRGLIADPRFLRELRAHHRKPPLLGVFSRKNRCGGIAFSPILGPPDRVPRQRFKLRGCSSAWDGYNLVDCRHGLVLLNNMSRTGFVVCDPVTGQQRRVAVPPEHRTHCFNGAVL